jgi:hypothetical protein
MMTLPQVFGRSIMERFLQRHAEQITGVLAGFDRVLFRGTLRSLSYVAGLDAFLGSQHVLYKDFGVFAERLSAQVKAQAEAIAQQHQRPLRYLESAQEAKEDIARAIMEKDGIREGLICVLTCVEPCRSFFLRKDAARKLLQLVGGQRKCLHVYYYYADREFGLMHVRVQTWLPFPMQVCLNGREYLARQLDKAKIGYEKRDNCFVRIDDLARAQKILDRLTRRKWPSYLRMLARRVNPLLQPASGLSLRDYYWTWRQGEHATDLMFKDAKSLKEIYPRLVRHALQLFGCRDLLRFLGRRVNRRFAGEVTTVYHERSEGVCVKHWVEENSIKMYDKQGSVLRIETTINNPRRFKVYRWATRHGKRCQAWLPMRKAVTDLPRLVEICQAANQRYLQALADVESTRPAHQVLDPVSERIVRDGRPYRGLRPVTAEEAALFACLLNGKYRLQGFRNADLRQVLSPKTPTEPSQRRAHCARASRYLRLLRAHGLIRKIPRTHCYRVTQRGTQVMTTALTLRQTTVASLAA